MLSQDRGQRAVVLRPEMTPTLARLVASQRQNLNYPLRWYSLPNVWRYERPQKGRLREHWQLNADLLGAPAPDGELELILIIVDIMRAFKARSEMYTIRLNSRAFLEAINQHYLGLQAADSQRLCQLLDRFDKLERSQFEVGVPALIHQQASPETQPAKTARLADRSATN